MILDTAGLSISCNNQKHGSVQVPVVIVKHLSKLAIFISSASLAWSRDKNHWFVHHLFNRSTLLRVTER